MIPGVTALGTFAVGTLPAWYDGSVPSLLAGAISQSPSRIILFVAMPIAPGMNGQPFPVYAASDEYASFGSDSPAHQIFRARLLDSYNMQFSLWGGLSTLPIPKQTTDGKSLLPAVHSQPGYGAISFVAADGDYDRLTRLSWVGCRIALYVVADATVPFANAVQIAALTVAGVTWNPQKITLAIRDYQQDFALPLQNELYTAGGVSYADATALLGVPVTTLAKPAGPCSVEMWIKPSISAATTRHIVGWRGPGAGLFAAYFSGAGTNVISVSAVNNAGTAFSYNDSLSLGADEWVQIAIVLDTAGGHLYLYINRTLRGSVAITGTFTTSASGTFAIGAGKLSELRVWSVARSLTDVGTNMYLTYPAASTSAYTGLYAYYTFAEGDGPTTADATGARSAIKLNGGAWDTGDWQQSQCLGKQKPVAIGDHSYPAEIPMQLVDPNAPGALVYQVHHRAFQSADRINHAGKACVLTTDYTVDLVRGYVFVLFNPTGAMTACVHGDVGGVDGLGYVSTKADIAVRIATSYGGLAYPTGVDLESVGRVNVVDPGPYRYFCNSAETLSTALDSLMDGGWWTFNRFGQFSVGMLELPSAAVADVGDDTEFPIVYGSVDRQPTPEPSKLQRVGYNHLWTVQAPAQLSVLLTPADRDLLSRADSFVAPGSTPAIVSDYPYALTVQTLTLRTDTTVNQVLVNAESIRRQTLFGQRQDIYQVRLLNAMFMFWLGDALTVTYREELPGLAAGSTAPRYDLSGWKCVIIGLVEVVASDPSQSDSITVVVWGPGIPGQLLVDSGTGDTLVVDTSKDTGLTV